MRTIKTFQQFRLTESLIAEALSLDKAKEFTSIKRNPAIQARLDSIFDKLDSLPDATTSKRGDRVYIPFSSSGGMVTHESPVKKEIESALQGTDFKLKDYSLGVATDKLGREVKLGKALNRIGRKDLVDLFNGDKERESSRKTDFIMVFSKHPYDIAGMSTDRGWTSCMELYKGENKRYLKYDVEEGSFICYLIGPDDTNLNRPTARILVKPFINVGNDKDVIYSPEPKVYGTSPKQFLKTVKKILSDIQGEMLGRFELSNKLYCDSKRTIIRVSPDVQSILDGKSKPKDRSMVKKVLESIGIQGYTINSDLSVDVQGNVDIMVKIKAIPVQFRVVSGNFNCSHNKLTTLEGAPQEVGGDFNCSHNKLTTLEGAPQEVGGDFNCNSNELTSLEGAPQEVWRDFYCNHNKLTSLEGAPQKVWRDFYCEYNQLTSTKGTLQEVRHFYCTGNYDLPQSEKGWARKNIEAKRFYW